MSTFTNVTTAAAAAAAILSITQIILTMIVEILINSFKTMWWNTNITGGGVQDARIN